MNKAIQIPYLDHSSFSAECTYAAQAGFRHLSVSYADLPLGKTADEWKIITEDIQGILEENNLTCVQSHLPYYYPFGASNENNEDMEFALRQSIISSGKVGAAFCVIHPRTAVYAGYSEVQSFEDNKKWISPLLECAIQHDTGIAAENLPIFPQVAFVRPLYSYNPDHLIALVDYFGDEHMGVCWDFGHAHLTEGLQAPRLERLGHRLKCTHIHNNWGLHDDHAPPLYGDIDWHEAMGALTTIGYTGPLTLETRSWYHNPALCRSFYKHNYDNLLYLESLMEQKAEDIHI